MLLSRTSILSLNLKLTEILPLYKEPINISNNDKFHLCNQKAFLLYLILCISFQEKQWICSNYAFHYRCYAHMIFYTRMLAVFIPEAVTFKTKVVNIVITLLFLIMFSEWRYSDLMTWLREKRLWVWNRMCKNSHHAAIWLDGPFHQKMETASPLLSSGLDTRFAWISRYSNRNHTVHVQV